MLLSRATKSILSVKVAENVFGMSFVLVCLLIVPSDVCVCYSFKLLILKVLVN